MISAGMVAARPGMVGYRTPREFSAVTPHWHSARYLLNIFRAGLYLYGTRRLRYDVIVLCSFSHPNCYLL